MSQTTKIAERKASDEKYFPGGVTSPGFRSERREIAFTNGRRYVLHRNTFDNGRILVVAQLVEPWAPERVHCFEHKPWMR